MKRRLGLLSLDVGGRDEILAECRALVGRGGAVFTVNSLMAERAHREREFAEVLGGADILTVDGVGVKRALALFGMEAELLSGVELGELITREENPSLAIIGGREGVAERAFAYLKAKNPRLRLSFAVCGYGHTDVGYLALLRRHRPMLCFVCLGSPKQEYLVRRAREASPKTLFFALGGSLDVYSGERCRAPSAVRSVGLEWLYRMLKEPKRLKEAPRLASFAFRMLRMAKKSTKNRPTAHGN